LVFNNLENRLLKIVSNRLTPCLKKFSQYGVKLPDSYTWERLDHPDKIKKLFETLGLRNIQCQKNQVGYYLESAKSWWDLVRYTGFRAFLNQLTSREAANYKDELLQEIDATKEEKGIFLNIEVITSIAAK